MLFLFYFINLCKNEKERKKLKRSYDDCYFHHLKQVAWMGYLYIYIWSFHLKVDSQNNFIFSWIIIVGWYNITQCDQDDDEYIQ
jgi:hypothetical protein